MEGERGREVSDVSQNNDEITKWDIWKWDIWKWDIGMV